MSEDQSINNVLSEFKKAGWVFAVLGGAGMLARLILTDEKYDTVRWTRMILAGTIVGVIAYFALYNSSIDQFYKSVICSVSGSLAPEMFNKVRRKFLQKAS